MGRLVTSGKVFDSLRALGSGNNADVIKFDYWLESLKVTA